MMTVRMIIVATVLSFGAIPGAWAQSSFTTGTASSNASAGYGGYGGGLYNYAPGYRHGYYRRER